MKCTEEDRKEKDIIKKAVRMPLASLFVVVKKLSLYVMQTELLFCFLIKFNCFQLYFGKR